SAEPHGVDVADPRGEAARALRGRETPSQLIAIERPGRPSTGEYLSARGESVAPWNSPLDEIFLLAGKRGRLQPRRSSNRPPTARGGHPSPPATVAVGDGGHQIGQGNRGPPLGPGGAPLGPLAPAGGGDHPPLGAAAAAGAP